MTVLDYGAEAGELVGGNDANRGRVRGRPFGPGNQPKGGSRKDRRFVRAVPLLRAFRHVLVSHEWEDRTEQQRLVRLMMKENLPAFIAAFSELEEQHATRVEALEDELARGPN
jgi:hypothetical protein